MNSTAFETSHRVFGTYVSKFQRNLQGKQFILKTEAKSSVRTLVISHDVILEDSYR